MSDATTPNPIPVFDGHNDTILSLHGTGRSFFERGEEGHVDLPRAKAGGLFGGFFAVFVRDPAVAPPDKEVDPEKAIELYSDPSKLPPMMELDYAQREAIRTFGGLLDLEARSGGQVRVVRSAAAIRACLEDGAFALELHIEGAEAIDPDFAALEVFHRAGLRSLGIVWSRRNIFGQGVPFGHGSPDTGDGLTDLGKELVRRCNQLRILLDLSHLNEKGFWDVARLSTAPLVATHSNAHAVSPMTRNLTDKQLAAIRDSDGLVGLNYHVGFLRPDGEGNPDTPLTVMADHLDYLIEHLGEERVGLGSDFDGATMPKDLADVSLQQNLVATLRDRGYDDALLRKICYENWLRVLEKTWGA